MSDLDAAMRQGAAILSEAGIEGARAETRMILSHVTGLSAGQIMSRGETELGAAAAAAFHTMLRRRAAGEPMAYVIGAREFWSLPFRVRPGVLIPRPDTETLVELALERFQGRPPPASILDLGTGSGCILMALLSEFPSAMGVGLDRSPDAFAVATENAVSLGMSERCRIFDGDWADAPAGPFDLIVSNPPYIVRDEIAGLMPEVRDFEPAAALDGGPDGLDAYRVLMPLAVSRMSVGGVAVFEVGAGQADEVSELASAAGLDAVGSKIDLGGIERAVSFHKKSIGKAGGSG